MISYYLIVNKLQTMYFKFKFNVQKNIFKKKIIYFSLLPGSQNECNATFDIFK
jgi:hypothetical protein